MHCVGHVLMYRPQLKQLWGFAWACACWETILPLRHISCGYILTEQGRTASRIRALDPMISRSHSAHGLLGADGWITTTDRKGPQSQSLERWQVIQAQAPPTHSTLTCHPVKFMWNSTGTAARLGPLLSLFSAGTVLAILPHLPG